MSDTLKLIEVSRAQLETDEGFTVYGWSVMHLERRGTSSSFFLILRKDQDAD